MIDEEGRWWCDQCGRRSAKGGIQVSTLGRGFPLRKLRAGPGVIYCSEGCLRDALFGLDPDEDPVEALTRQVRSLQRKLQRQAAVSREAIDEAAAAASAAAGRFERPLELLDTIEAEGLLTAVSDDERGRRLQHLLTNVLAVSRRGRRL